MKRAPEKDLQSKDFLERGDTCVQSEAAHLCGAAPNAQGIDEFKGFNAACAVISTLQIVFVSVPYSIPHNL